MAARKRFLLLLGCLGFLFLIMMSFNLWDMPQKIRDQLPSTSASSTSASPPRADAVSDQLPSTSASSTSASPPRTDAVSDQLPSTSASSTSASPPRTDAVSEKRIQQQQEPRKRLIKEVCGDREVLSKEHQSVDDLSHGNLYQLLVDDTQRIIYCYIPKVACTHWKSIMLVLKGGRPYQDPMSFSKVHNNKNLTLLSSFSKTEIKAKLKHYTKFMFVRDPFVRLISAFRNKFLQPDGFFYNHFGRDILHRYGNQSDPPMNVDEAFEAGMRPSFYNFVQYLVDPLTESRKPFNPHWRQMHRLCHPCDIQYDFIGHQENLQEEAEYLLTSLGLQNDIKFPVAYENMTTSDSVLDWFREVPLEDRRKLFKIYETDFRLFGYRKPTELLDG